MRYGSVIQSSCYGIHINQRIGVIVGGFVLLMNLCGARPLEAQTVAGTWQHVPGVLTQIAVGSAESVWGINSAQQIYRFNPQTHGWDHIPGALTQIAVGSANAVWGVNAKHQIFHFNSQTQSWDHVPGALTQIAVGSAGLVWGINASQQVWRFDPRTQGWDRIPGALAQIAVAADTSVWGLNAQQQIFRFDPQTQGWDHIPGALVQIAVGSAKAVWGLNAKQQIFQFNSQTQGWKQFSGALAKIAVGADGSVWGINAQQQIFELNVSGGNSGNPQPVTSVNLAGDWQFTAKSMLVPLTFTGEGSLSQVGTPLSGQFTLNGSPCAATAALSGTVVGTTMNFQLQEGNQAVSFTGTVAMNGLSASGTYRAPSGGCTQGDFGNWTATRSSGSPQPVTSVNLTGDWQFTAESMLVPLTFTGLGSLSQVGTPLLGGFTLNGSPCATTANLSGTVVGTTMNFQLQEGNQAVSFTGTVAMNELSASGTYRAPSGGCTQGDFGNWTATRIL